MIHTLQRVTPDMKHQNYKIRFPSTIPHSLRQEEAYFYLDEEGETKRIGFHDYHELYAREGLYEQIYYQRLKCRSPHKVAQILCTALRARSDRFSELRVLDLGAGNGVMGEVLAAQGPARLVGVDILDVASTACQRDRPGVYDAYYVTDMADPSNEIHCELLEWRFTCLTCVAALGFSDIPPTVFIEAYNLIQPEGWIAFNIKETFLQESDKTGFSTLIRDLLLSNTLQICHIERYRHRLSIDGSPLFYYAVVGKKKADIHPMTAVHC